MKISHFQLKNLVKETSNKPKKIYKLKKEKDAPEHLKFKKKNHFFPKYSSTSVFQRLR